MTGLIEASSSRDAADSLHDHRRSATHTQLLARITALQAKDIPIWEPKTSTSVRAAGVVFLVLNFRGSGFEIWVSREGKFDPDLR
jgi:hypothetical protein